MSFELEVHNLTRTFGAVAAVNDVSLQIEKGERHGLIGPNGAGKSTLFSLIAGAQPPSSGHILFKGKDITDSTMAQRARMGIQQTFQHSKLFLPETVEENVALAVRRVQHVQRKWWRNAGSAPYARIHDRAMECLELVNLGHRADAITSSLSHGERRQLEVALLLAGEPQVILLDEPTAGMSLAETNRFVDLIQGLPRDLSIIIVEHDLDVVFAIANRVSALNLGRLMLTGTPDEVRSDAEVQAAYLGAGDEGDIFIDKEAS